MKTLCYVRTCIITILVNQVYMFTAFKRFGIALLVYFSIFSFKVVEKNMSPGPIITAFIQNNFISFFSYSVFVPSK